MGSESLTDQQRDALVVQLRRHLTYLNKLTEKMLKNNWPLEDPVRDKGIDTQKAMPSPICEGLGIRVLHAKVGSRVAVFSRLHSSLRAAARTVAKPAPTKSFTFELSSHELHRWDVEYDYAATTAIALAGLAPAGQAALQAATQIAQMFTDWD